VRQVGAIRFVWNGCRKHTAILARSDAVLIQSFLLL
jgi:hypothetical protein